MTPVQRFLPPAYSDGLQAPRLSVGGAPLPSPREISASIHENRRTEASSVTHLLMQWGQFIDHDVTSSSQSRGFNGSVPRCCRDGGRDVEPPEFLHPDCLPILVPANDPFYRRFGIRCLEFLRSSPASRQDCELGWREQINQVTAYLDGSPLYGSSVKQSDKLRLFRNGMLQYGRVQSRKPLLSPEREDKDELCRRGAVSTDCFKSGDNRVNEHPGLVAMHIVWLRMHNRMANELAHLNSHWSDEKIYQETRKIVGAMIQHINYNEFLPIVVGAEVVRLFGLKPLRKGFYKEYSRKVNASPGNAFGAAAFRFGHSLVQSSFMRYNRFHEPLPGNVSLHEEVSNPDNLWSFSAVDHLLTGMLDQPAQKRDEFITDELTNHLFQTPRFRFGMDLAAINIQRGRDHGLPPYVAWREPCGLTNIENWSDLNKIMSPRSVNRLQDVYRSVRDIDLFTGGMCERPVIGGLVGPTFACIIAQQFSNLQKGDRFWYENGNFESSFTPAQLQQIRRVTLAQVMCKTLDSIITIQPFVFLTADNYSNERLSCDSDYIENFELSPWIERQSDFVNGISNFDRHGQTTRKPANFLQTHEKLEVQFPNINITVTTTKPPHSTETVTFLDNKLDFDLPQDKLPDNEDDDSQDSPPTGQHKVDGKLDFRAAKRKLQNSMSLKQYFEPIDQHQRQKNLESSNVYNILSYETNTDFKRHRADETDDNAYSHFKKDSTSENIRESNEHLKTYQYDRLDSLYYLRPQPNYKQNYEPSEKNSHQSYDDFDSYEKEKFQNYDFNAALQRPIDSYQTDELHRYKNRYQTDRYQNVQPIKVTDNNKRFTYLVNIVPKTTPRYHSNLRDPVKITYQNSNPQRYHYPNLNNKPTYEYNDFVQRPLTYVTVQSPENDYYKNEHDTDNADNRYELWTKIQSNFRRRTPNKPEELLKNSPVKTYELDMTDATTENDHRLITFTHIFRPNESIKSVVSNPPSANLETTRPPGEINQKKSNTLLNFYSNRTRLENIHFDRDTPLHKGVIKDNKPIQMTIPQVNGQTIIKTEQTDELNPQTLRQNFHDDKRPNRNDKTVVNDTKKISNDNIPDKPKQVSSTHSKNDTTHLTNDRTILNETINEKELNRHDTNLSDRHDTIVFINNQPKITNYDYDSREQNNIDKSTSQSMTLENKNYLSQQINDPQQQMNYNHETHPKDLNKQQLNKLLFTFENKQVSALSDYEQSLNERLKQKLTDFTDLTTDTDTATTNNILTTFYTYRPLERTTGENTNINKQTNEIDQNKKMDMTTPNSVRYFYIGNVLHKYPQQNIESLPGVIKNKIPTILKQNLAIIDENYNNPWKKLSTDRTEFSDLDLNFRTKSNAIGSSKTVMPISVHIEKDNIKRSSMDTNTSEQSNTKKLLKKGNIHVPFEVIPSENSPNLWKFYHEREEMSNPPKKSMPQMASDPQALKELPKPMNLSIIANYRKKTRPTA